MVWHYLFYYFLLIYICKNKFPGYIEIFNTIFVRLINCCNIFDFNALKIVRWNDETFSVVY